MVGTEDVERGNGMDGAFSAPRPCRRMTHQPSRADFGPRVVLARGERVESTAPDLDRPHVRDATVRVVRAVCHYDALWRADAITDDQREAADCYAKLIEIAAGARYRGEEVHIGRPPWMSGQPAEWMVRATTEIRLADEAVGPDATTLIRLLVVANLPLVAVAQQRGVNSQVAKGEVRQALQRLYEHFETRPSQKVVDRL